jgi:LytS/YehU family sensor histidine kinase
VLLLAEALIRAAPNADPQHIIGAKLKPVPDGQGGIEMSQVGHSTIDFQQIGERAKDFGIALDHKALKALNTIRNDMEHHYTSESATAIRAAISKGFPVAASLFRQMDEIRWFCSGGMDHHARNQGTLTRSSKRRATLKDRCTSVNRTEVIKCGNCQSGGRANGPRQREL